MEANYEIGVIHSEVTSSKGLRYVVVEFIDGTMTICRAPQDEPIEGVIELQDSEMPE